MWASHWYHSGDPLLSQWVGELIDRLVFAEIVWENNLLLPQAPQILPKHHRLAAAIGFTGSMRIGRHRETQKMYGQLLSWRVSLSIDQLKEGESGSGLNLISSCFLLQMSLHLWLIVCLILLIIVVLHFFKSWTFQAGAGLCTEMFSSSAVEKLVGGAFAYGLCSQLILGVNKAKLK